ncbi:unnamed protein product [Protopolystoma xenopodis]|uniref:F5/8 type C domain-containing protein n=1 Tax=Protopolystoma xenopodis TaxID=117903 RepID=A0A448WXK6_9PLAT|nr:unnamed protein product [Protopolystoma xenopodis]
MPQIFEGNRENVPERIHYLTKPFVSRYIRIHPINWRGRVSMRIGLLGCRHKGSCGDGFFRINNQSSCGKSDARRR